jgi:hypothetical protein
MDTGSNKKGSKLERAMKQETEPLERSGKEGHAEDFREQQGRGEEEGTGHRLAGSGSSADDYTYRDRGEEGGASHPKPKDSEDPSG